MGLFVQSDGDSAVIVAKGVYKQVPIFTRDGLLYAAYGGGYVRLKEDGSTSQPTARLDHLDFDGELHRDQMGRLCVPSPDRQSKPLEDQRKQLLIGET